MRALAGVGLACSASIFGPEKTRKRGAPIWGLSYKSTALGVFLRMLNGGWCGAPDPEEDLSMNSKRSIWKLLLGGASLGLFFTNCTIQNASDKGGAGDTGTAATGNVASG